MIHLYRLFLWPILKTAFFILRFFNRKIARGWEMRQRNTKGAAPWQEGPSGQQPIWIHCASGEFEYAKPVLELIRKRHPDARTLVTFFSPSIERAVRESKLVDIALPMPWDTPRAWGEFFTHHQPKMLLIARTDTWPEMLFQSKLRKIPSLLFSATLTESSGRAQSLARPITRWIFSQITEIFCVSEADHRCFESLGVGEKTKIAGDTRFDQVQARLKNPKPLIEDHFRGSLPRFVAGSTWREDEAVLLEVMPRFKSQIQWILVPHEPTPDHLREIESQLTRIGFTHLRYSQPPGPHSPPDVLVIDQIGILAELYLRGKFAFVGGSFRKTVHSVMEPLAAGCLTFVGPKVHNNREALEFSKIDLKPDGDYTPVEICNTADELTGVLERACKDFSESASARIQNEIKLRSNKSELVCDWIDDRLSGIIAVSPPLKP